MYKWPLTKRRRCSQPPLKELQRWPYMGRHPHQLVYTLEALVRHIK